MQTSQVFRLFVSSTFSDFVVEREALQNRVFPELEKFCAERGARFQAVDLRWGITEEAQREHNTLRICLEEVRRCQVLSPRPNFAVLLGDRYGWEPVPARITLDHWKKLLAAAAGPDVDLICAGYEGPDQNAIPPVMHLRELKGEWASTELREASLRAALRRAADEAVFTGDERLSYFASATHQEIVLGALDTRDEEGNPMQPEEHVNVYARHIEGLPNDVSAQAFIDWDVQRQTPVPGARKRLKELETQLRDRLPENVRDIHARWLSDGTDGSHIDAFCAKFLADQKGIIERELSSRKKLQNSEYRNAQHQSLAKERARNFAGRKTVLRRIAAYLELQSTNSPLIVHGGGGNGKSALIASAYLKAVETVPETTVILARFIGGVPGTESLMTLLTELTADIATAFGQSAPPIPESIKAARQAFEEALQGTTADRPLVLFLDALDQLDRTDGSWLLEWLPKRLGEHTRVVATTREGQTLHSAQRRYPKMLLEVPAMTIVEGRQMLDAWLADTREAHFNAGITPARGRMLTKQQRKQVLSTFAQTGKPLWLKLAYEQARSWESWLDAMALPETVEEMVADLVARRLLEVENHPRVFAMRALAYITAGRFGLAEEELDQALATDPEVIAEFEAQNAKTGHKWELDEKRPRLPPILWSRLYFDLQPYLARAQIDGTVVYRWFHREFKEEIGKRYLIDEDSRKIIHGHLADTFLAMAPFGDDLFKYTDISGVQQPAALRRVMEQPWQLAHAFRPVELQTLLTDFGFCMGKCATNRFDDLISDIFSARSTSASLLPWYRYLIAWRRRLRCGDQLWPAHRILVQLIGESSDFRELLLSDVYEPYVSSTYFSNQTTKVEKLQLRRITLISDLQTFDHTEFLLYDDRWLLAIDATGVGTMIDIDQDLVIGIAHIEIRNIFDLEEARVFSIDASSVVRLQAEGTHSQKFDRQTKFPGVLRIHGSEVVIGNETVIYLGSIGNDLMFSCEGQLLLINADQLTEPDVAPGSFSIEGIRIESMENLTWDYSRFGIVIFLKEDTFLSLGWEASHQRDEIKAEIWDFNYSGTSLRAEITLNDGIDFPLAVLGILPDGRVVFTGENYRRSYIIDPQRPERSFEHLWPVAWSWFDPKTPDRWHLGANSTISEWRWPDRIKKESEKQITNRFKGWMATNLRYWVRIGQGWSFGSADKIEYQELPLIACAEYLDEGSYVLWGDMEEIDSSGTAVIDFQVKQGEFVRWFADVPIICAAHVRQNEIVVVKRSGPVTLRRGLGDLKMS